MGFLIIRSLVQDLAPLISLGISFPLGAGMYTWMLFVLSWIGISLTSASLILSYIMLLALSLGFYWYSSTKQLGSVEIQDGKSSTGLGTRWKWILVLTCGLLFLISAVIAVGRSYSSWDAIAIWAAKGYGISLENSIFAGVIWGAHQLEYPLNMPLLISSFRTLEGDILPGSKLLFPFFYLALLTGSFFFWRTCKISFRYAYVGLLFISTIPIVFEHSTIGYANLPFSVYLILGTLLGIIGINRGSKGLQLLSGSYLSLAVWTRPEGIFVIPITILSLLAASRVIKARKIHLLIMLAPVAVIIGAWVVFGRINGAQELFTSAIQSLWGSFSKGEFHFDALYWIARFLGRQLLEIKAWGLLFPLAILLMILHYQKFNPKRYPLSFVALVPALSVGLSIVGFYYLVSFVGDLRPWLETSVNRMFLPAGLLGSLWLILFSGSRVVNETRGKEIVSASIESTSGEFVN